MRDGSEQARLRAVAGVLGLSACVVLVGALVVFAWLNPEFHPLDDYISKLGAKGEPYAIWWNLFGFVMVGLLLVGFGSNYGRLLEDRTVSFLLAAFGIGFAATGIPVELGNEEASVSKAHVVAICLGLAAYLFCLARLGHVRSFARPVRLFANTAAAFLGVVMAGQVLQFWRMATTHRLVLAVVFAWVAATSIGLLRRDPRLGRSACG